MSSFFTSIDTLVDPVHVIGLVRGLKENDFSAARALRLEATNQLLQTTEVDCLVLSIGADMPWLCGYQAMPLERLTALVIPKGERPTLVVPRLEAPRVRHDADLFNLLPWDEDQNPFELVAKIARAASCIGVSDRMWASALLELQVRNKESKFVSGSALITQLREAKDELELLLLARAAHITDDVAFEIFSGVIDFEGRTEREVSEDISSRLLAKGLSRVNFAIVGAGQNSASPHHEPGRKVIEAGDPVVCDFGGIYSILEEPGYCSDITRTVGVRHVSQEFVELYDVLQAAQEVARTKVSSSMSGKSADMLARQEITKNGYGEYFIHRTGHGIGMEEHEGPYISSVNLQPIGSFSAFSIEPGIYMPQKFGARIEDICVTGEHCAVSLNNAPRNLYIV